MSTTHKNNPPKKVSNEKEEDKKLWPREDMRAEDEKANAEVERHLWPEGDVKEEEEKKIWPREGERGKDEKASAEVERDLWTEDEEKKREQPK
jgi:hypothetical protein